MNSREQYSLFYDPNVGNYLIQYRRNFKEEIDKVSYDCGAIDVAAGEVNALTVSPNNKTAVVNGTSVAAAIVAGACSMLFEWGDVQGNNPNMYA